MRTCICKYITGEMFLKWLMIFSVRISFKMLLIAGSFHDSLKSYIYMYMYIIWNFRFSMERLPFDHVISVVYFYLNGHVRNDTK